MSNPWSGGGSHSSNPWGGSGKSTSTKKHHGLLHKIVHGGTGFVSHLAKDVEQAAVGLPMGLVLAGKHPIRSIEDIGKTTWQDWSPLFHGHVGKFAHDFYEHPLAPLLDIASVVTLGAGSVARGGSALGKLGVISKESRLAKLGEARTITLHGPQGDVYRHLPANPATRALHEAAHSAVSKVMPNWRGGEYGRLVEHDTAQRSLAKSHVSHDVQQAMGGVFKTANLLGHHPQEYFRVVDENMHQGLIRFARRSTAEHSLSKVDKKGNVTLTAPSGVAFIRKEAPKTPGINSIEDVQQHLESFGRRHTTRRARPEDIVLDDKGNPLLVPDHSVKVYGEEGTKSTALMKAIYYKPTHIWKWAVLTTPRFFVNNAVGNTLMAMNAIGPAAFARGTLDALKDTHGNRVALRGAEDFNHVTQKALGNEADVIDKWYLGPHKEGFAYESAQSSKLHERLTASGHPNLGKVLKTGSTGLFNFTHRVAEKGIRRVTIKEMLRKSPEVKAAMKRGKSLHDAIDEVSADPAFRARIQHQMDNVLGQYHYYNGLEQHLRRVIPFYGWDRAIMRHARTMAVEHPGRTAVGVGLGQQGVEATHEALGDIPSFMEGLIPLGGNKVLSTQGFNPYASVPDTVNPALALVGLGNHKPGEAMAMQLNPFIAGLIESTTGQSLLSGAKLPHHSGGIVGDIAATTVEGLPYTKLLETLIGGEQQPKPNRRTGKKTPFLYRKDARTQVAALLGVPVKEINKQRAGELGRRERGETKGRHKKGIWG